MWPCTNIFHIQVEVLLYYFATLPKKLKLWKQIGRGLLIANHLDQLLWWANQKHRPPVRSYLLDCFLLVHSLAASFTSHRKLCNYAEPKPFSTIFLSETSTFWLFFIQFYRLGSHPKHRWRCSNINDFHPPPSPGITTMASSTPRILDVCTTHVLTAALTLLPPGRLSTALQNRGWIQIHPLQLRPLIQPVSTALASRLLSCLLSSAAGGNRAACLLACLLCLI
jgi:hypothetical protein